MHLAGTILPIFAIILAGSLAGTSCYMPRALAAPLMRFAYYVAMPSLVFLTIADESLHALLDSRFLAAFGGGSMICFAAVMMFERNSCVAGSKKRHAGSCRLITNTAFVALPILSTLFRPPRVLAAAIATVFVCAIMFPTLVLLLEIGRYDTSRNILSAALIRQIATNPVILATICALLWSMLGSPLSGPVASTLTDTR